MKKLSLIVIVMIAAVQANAQGVITLENNKVDVPIEQYYVIRDKDFNNHSFYYAEHYEAKEELKRILSIDNQSAEFPKDIDADGDPYWVILYENEYVSHIYFSKDGNSKYSVITIVTE
jgi:hypothetical protein